MIELELFNFSFPRLKINFKLLQFAAASPEPICLTPARRNHLPSRLLHAPAATSCFSGRGLTTTSPTDAANPSLHLASSVPPSLSSSVQVLSSFQRIHLNISSGEDAVDYEEVQTDEKLNSLEMRALQLVNQVNQMKREQDYQRVCHGGGIAPSLSLA